MKKLSDTDANAFGENKIKNKNIKFLQYYQIFMAFIYLLKDYAIFRTCEVLVEIFFYYNNEIKCVF